MQYAWVTKDEQSRLLKTLKKKPFENIVRKGEKAGNKHFALFAQCFLPIPKRISVFQLHSFCLQMLSILTSLKMCPLVKSQIVQFPLKRHLMAQIID